MIGPTSTGTPWHSDAELVIFNQNLANEIGDLIASIRLSGEMLLGDLPKDIRNELQLVIVTESERMEEIIERAVYFTSLTKPRAEPLLLQELLDLARDSSGVPIPVIFDPQPDCLEDTITGDYPQSVRLFHELIRNAVDAGATSLRVVCHRSKDLTDSKCIEVLVIDDGEGCSTTDFDRLFVPFVSNRDGHAGLGLAIVRSIAELHGWSIELRDGDTSGTVAMLRMPA